MSYVRTGAFGVTIPRTISLLPAPTIVASVAPTAVRPAATTVQVPISTDPRSGFGTATRAVPIPTTTAPSVATTIATLKSQANAASVVLEAAKSPAQRTAEIAAMRVFNEQQKAAAHQYVSEQTALNQNMIATEPVSLPGEPSWASPSQGGGNMPSPDMSLDTPALTESGVYAPAAIGGGANLRPILIAGAIGVGLLLLLKGK